MDKLPITEHLGELRQRILVSFAVIAIGVGVSFYFSEKIFSLLVLPMNSTVTFSRSYPFFSFGEAGAPHVDLVFLAPAEALWMHLKIAFISGIVISSPVLLYEFWQFTAPGLLEREKKYLFPFIIITLFLFLLGSLFCFFVVLPFAMHFLLTYKTEVLKPMLSVGRYVDFCLKFILGFGAVFELPVVLVFLTRMGVITPQFLSKNRKYAIILAFVLAAFLTPTPDAFNQSLMAVPIIILYEAGILASRLFGAQKANPRDMQEKDPGNRK